jgi:hypothetical protein
VFWRIIIGGLVQDIRASLLQWGNFSRIPEPLYYRLDHAGSYTRQHWDKVHRTAWTTLFTAFLDAAMQSCRTVEQRRFFQQAILERIIAFAEFQGNPETVVAEFLERLRLEGNTHLLDLQESPTILQNLQSRVDELEQRSRFRRVIGQIRQRYEFAEIIYPGSPMRRLRYKIDTLIEIAKKLREFLSTSIGLRRAT